MSNRAKGWMTFLLAFAVAQLLYAAIAWHYASNTKMTRIVSPVVPVK
jgi:hypothetical protein